MENKDILCQCNGGKAEFELLMELHDDPLHEEGTWHVVDDGEPRLITCQSCGKLKVVVPTSIDEPECNTPDTEEDVPF